MTGEKSPYASAGSLAERFRVPVAGTSIMQSKWRENEVSGVIVRLWEERKLDVEVRLSSVNITNL